MNPIFIDKTAITFFIINMQILILGATGRTGKLLVQLSLEKGYNVRVLIRDMNKLQIAHPRLEIIEGAVTDRAMLKKAMAGVDAILSCLNISRTNDFPWSPLRTPKDFLSTVMKLVIDEAGKQQISRIIVVSAWGVGETKVDIPGWFRWFIDNSNIKYPYLDHAIQEQLLMQSSMEWTVVRPTGLTSFRKKKVTMVTIGKLPRPTITITRYAVAEFMLEVLEKGLYIREKPIISAQHPGRAEQNPDSHVDLLPGIL